MASSIALMPRVTKPPNAPLCARAPARPLQVTRSLARLAAEHNDKFKCFNNFRNLGGP